MNFRNILTPRNAKLVLLLYGLVTLLSIVPLRSINFDYDFEKFFPRNDSGYAYYEEFLKTFGKDNDVLLLAVEAPEGIFKQDFLQRTDSLCKNLKTIKGVEYVLSPVNMKLPVISAFGMAEIPYFHINEPHRYADDSSRIYQSQLLMKNMVPPNGKSLCMVLKIDSGLGKLKEDTLIQSVKKNLTALKFEKYHLAGRIISQSYMVDKMQWELLIFMSTSAVLVIIFLIIAFRSVWGVIIPVTVVMLSALYLVSLMCFLGKSLDILTVLLPTILFVVGMSDVVHIWSKYLSELRLGKAAEAALYTTLKEVGLATLLTSLTTAIGFLSLLTANIAPVRDLGLYTSIGVVFAYIIAFTLLPACLLLLGSVSTKNEPKSALLWDNILHILFRFILKNQKLIVGIFLLLSVLSAVLIPQIKINATLLGELSEKEQLKKDLRFMEQNYAGVRPFEMVLTLKDSTGTFDSYRNLKAMEQVENYLTQTYGLRFVMSPLILVKSLNKSLNGGNEAYYKLPTEEELPKIVSKLKYIKKRDEFKRLVSADGRKIRVTGRMDDIGSYYIAIKNDSLNSYFARNEKVLPFTHRLTGSALLIDKNNEYLSSNLVQGLSIGFVVIGIIIFILFRSYSMLLIFFIPNIIPLLFIGGIMAISGIDLKVSTSIIFTIAFGIAVDDTIHFLSKLKIELAKGSTLLYATKRTFLTTGKAMIVTSIILCGGFLTLLLSDFNGTFYTGLLIGLILFFALLADLFLLPVLLIKLAGKLYR